MTKKQPKKAKVKKWHSFPMYGMKIVPALYAEGPKHEHLYFEGKWFVYKKP